MIETQTTQSQAAGGQEHVSDAAPRGDEFNICGVLVHYQVEKDASVREALALIPGLEIHQQADAGRLIVTVEDTDASKAINSLSAIHTTPGVVSAALVYHHFEPGEDAGSQNRE